MESDRSHTLQQTVQQTAVDNVRPAPLSRGQTLLWLEHTSFGAACSIAYNRSLFGIWKLVNNDKTFADFYVWRITSKLDRGRAHRTLGIHRFDAKVTFGKSPAHDLRSFAKRRPSATIEHLFQLGLQPHHRLVDYGCGSLRLGMHLIDYLDPDCYRGLDVTARFYSDGLTMIDPQILAEKQPRCRVINSENLQLTQAEGLDFVISNAVLKHVPPACIDDYFDAICTLMNKTTTLVIGFPASQTEKQIAGKSWSYPVEHIKRQLLARCPDRDVAVTSQRPPHVQNGVELRQTILVMRPRSGSA